VEPCVRIRTPSCLLRPSRLSSALVFLRDLRPPSTAMAAELPPSWFKTTDSLASLRQLMGWQAPGLACKVKMGAASLANMRPGDFVFFAAYALAGLVPPLSFFLTLLEYYGLQLQHLSPNSIALVAIFVHLCEMYGGGTAIGVTVPAREWRWSWGIPPLMRRVTYP
jgi:hypothetical protein